MQKLDIIKPVSSSKRPITLPKKQQQAEKRPPMRFSFQTPKPKRSSRYKTIGVFVILCLLLFGLAFFGPFGLLLYGIMATLLLVTRTDARFLFALALFLLVCLPALEVLGKVNLGSNVADLAYLSLGTAAVALGMQARSKSAMSFSKQVQ